MRNRASNSWSRSLKFKTLALTMLATVISGQSMATTPPSPVWQAVTLSDGTSSDIILRGTAAFHWHEDKQGNALIKKDGHWFFAEIKRESDSPILVSTGVEKTQSTSAPEASQLRPSVLVKPALSSLCLMYVLRRKFTSHKQNHEHRFCQYHQTKHCRKAKQDHHAHPPIHGLREAFTLCVNFTSEFGMEVRWVQNAMVAKQIL